MGKSSSEKGVRQVGRASVCLVGALTLRAAQHLHGQFRRPWARARPGQIRACLAVPGGGSVRGKVLTSLWLMLGEGLGWMPDKVFPAQSLGALGTAPCLGM